MLMKRSYGLSKQDSGRLNPVVSGKSDIVDITYGKILFNTDKAWGFSIGGETIWIPKSLGELDEQEGTVAIPQWLAEEKEIESYANL